MTKEQFIEKLTNEHTYEELLFMIGKFFDANIVIQKRSTRHKFADVFHEWVEGVHIQASVDNKHFNDIADIKVRHAGSYYRVQPCAKDHIYEWQWLELGQCGIWETTGYETTKESDAIGEGTGRTPKYRIEQTKRIRK